MTAAPMAALYSPHLLSLAVELANYPFDKDKPAIGHARSRTCGSTISLSGGSPERIDDLGMRVAACAVGQAAAAVFAQSAQGRDAADIGHTLDELRGWIAGSGPAPDWPGIAALEPALPHAGRHEAILLPWRAALDALCNERAGG